MRSTHRLALLAAVVGSINLVGCATKEHPTVREVTIMGDTQIDVTVFCAKKPQPYVLVTETATEVRLLNQYAALDTNCVTSDTLTLHAPLGTRNIVDAHDGHTIPVQSDYRCGDPNGISGRCDGIHTPSPPPYTP
ncbi:MAG: hypothetical protein WCI22_12585 [Actinomycetota bacterium]